MNVEGMGHRVFHIESIAIKGSDALLEVVFRGDDNGWEKDMLIYPFPPDFLPVLEALKDACPVHMVGFQEQDGKMYLADARTVWGYLCPCND